MIHMNDQQNLHSLSTQVQNITLDDSFPKVEEDIKAILKKAKERSIEAQELIRLLQSRQTTDLKDPIRSLGKFPHIPQDQMMTILETYWQSHKHSKKTSSPSVILDGALKKTAIEESINFMIQYIKLMNPEKTMGTGSRALAKTLRTLSWILYENSILASKFHEDILILLENTSNACLSSGSAVPTRASLLRRVLICAGNLLLRTGNKFQTLHERIFMMVEMLIHGCLSNASTSLKASFYKAFEMLVEENSLFVPRVISVVQNDLVSTLRAIPTRSTISSYTHESGSELSDIDSLKNTSGNTLSKNAMLLFRALFHADAKSTFPLIPGLFSHRGFLTDSDGVVTASSSRDFLVRQWLQTANGDPELREVVYSTLTSIFELANAPFKMAENINEKKGAFTSLSSQLAGILVYSLLSVLDTLVEAKDNASVIPLCSKVIIAIMKATSFDKVVPDVRSEVVTKLFSNIPVGTNPWKCGALKILSFVISTKYFSAGTVSVRHDGAAIQSLLTTVLDLAKSHYNDRDLLVEVFECLSSIVESYPSVYVSFWTTSCMPLLQNHLQSLDSLQNGSQDSSYARVVCAKHLDVCAKSMIFEENNTSPEMIQWGLDIANMALPLLNDDGPVLRAIGCSILSNLPSPVLSATSVAVQGTMFSCSMSLIADSAPEVRASVAGLIGALAVTPSMKEFPMFLLDATNAVLNLVKDDHVSVRNRSAWALGNVLDLVISLKTETRDPMDMVMYVQLITPLAMQALKASPAILKDNEKSRQHGPRIFANSIRLLNEDALLRQKETVLKEAMNALVLNLNQGSFKTRWNACYAMTTILSLRQLPHHCSWIDSVWNGLCKAATTCKNYKCIDALWKSYQAMNNVSQTSRFGEYKYEEQMRSGLVSASKKFLLLYSPYVSPEEKTILETLENIPIVAVVEMFDESTRKKLNFNPVAD